MAMELKSKHFNGFRTDGSRAIEDLARLAELMGYKQSGQFAINQMQLNNGHYVSSILNFFEDNSGAIEAIHEWIREQYATEIEENDAACNNGGCEDEGCEKCYDNTPLTSPNEE